MRTKKFLKILFATLCMAFLLATPAFAARQHFLTNKDGTVYEFDTHVPRNGDVYTMVKIKTYPANKRPVVNSQQVYKTIYQLQMRSIGFGPEYKYVRLVDYNASGGVVRDYYHKNQGWTVSKPDGVDRRLWNAVMRYLRGERG